MNATWASSYEAAVAMYNREHDRWYQWALFFFGAVGGIFYIVGTVQAPPVVAPALSCVVSLMWVGVASNIRTTTDCWRDVLLDLEADPKTTEGAFHIFKRRLEAYNHVDDFLKTLQLWRRRTYTSVTRLLVLSGIFSCIGFLIITVLGFLGGKGLVQPGR